ncbi:MurR/RpiR family transcriptional regulator [Anaerostipes sp.]|uniref:MurR/RpiR family transcriptional regulator n=1 Tax=Anaerostipes sp. TaxID=1872530 RepID=UPI0025C2E852|nr:MurR/RpiR family transcriptional regulator [Anaerostipes sp.]MBS7009441.1 MurR/RpiR family transcriptional regulator [Anaerostipes sp.]
MTIQNMINLCPDLTPAEADIASYVLSHKELVTGLSIQKLEEEIHVSKSAVHRFCKKIGLKGFNDLKVALARDLAEQASENRMIDVNYPFGSGDTQREIAQKMQKLYEEAVHDTYHYIDPSEMQRVTRLLYQAKTVDIYTHAHNLNVAENFQDKMLTIGRAVNCPKTFYKQRLQVLASGRDHAALVLSYSGKATFIEPVVKMLHEKKVPVILIGRADSNWYPQYISHTLFISDKENLRDRISQFSSHIAMQYMLDVIYGCIYNMDREKNITYLRDAINFMDDREMEGEI